VTGRDTWLDAVRQVVGDKPLFLIAGATDLVNEKLRQLPDALNSLQEDSRDFPFRAASVIVGQAFRANLKVGELYDDLARRGEHVVARMQGEPDYAEEDEPFVRQPYLPEPVHPAPPAVPAEPVVKAPAAPATKVAKKAPPAKKAAPAAAKKAAPAKKTAPAKKSRPDQPQ
jgi:hypothetical protein